MCSEIMVSTHELVKHFNDVTALNGVTMEIPEGIFGLIGPNGAGKTTLFRILIGLISPDSGEAYVCGQSIHDHSLEIRRIMGVLHERPIYPKHLSARTYLQHISDLYDSSGDPEEYLALVGLSEAADRKVKTFSAGMIQRLGLAQALIGHPRLILLDEPTSNLDVLGREAILNLIVELHQKSGTSFLIASHVLSDLEKVCTSVAFLNKGRIVKQGDILDVVWAEVPNEYIIVVSNPTLLQRDLKNEECINNVQISGSRSLVVEIGSEFTEQDLTEIVSAISDRDDIRVYSIERRSSLEGAFRRVVDNEE